MLGEEKSGSSRLPAEAKDGATAVAEPKKVAKNGAAAPPTPAAESESATNKPKRSGKHRRKARVSGQRGQPKRPFPRATLEKAIAVARALKDKNGGKPMPLADIAVAVDVGPKTTVFYYLLAAAQQFGLTEGNFKSEQISLSVLGREIVYASSSVDEQLKIKDALLRVEIFKKVLEHYGGSALPEMQYLGNTLTREFSLPTEFHEEFVTLFKANCEFVKIAPGPGAAKATAGDGASTVTVADSKTPKGLKCFVALPFRVRDGARPPGFFEEVLRALIAPAGSKAGFDVLTAKRDGSDVIHATIVNDLLDADLVIADLTENNPNVLFELGLRINHDQPVALIRAIGTPPIFDVDHLLRVYEYNPNLWSSTVEQDLPKLVEHIKGAWDARNGTQSFMKILRGKKLG